MKILLIPDYLCEEDKKLGNKSAAMNQEDRKNTAFRKALVDSFTAGLNINPNIEGKHNE